jgi:5'-deoxynucleotidase YfbR-like HD superfamily hydrolase
MVSWGRCDIFDFIMTEHAQGLVDIGRLIFKFARINRVTYHEDGSTLESDTDHTVMLAVCACALAKKLYPNSLDIGLVSQFAIVHDLVEAYANDVDSFGITPEAKAQKDKKEHEALLTIKEEFAEVYAWLPQTIEQYESFDTREARFVKTVDKIMHKITHVLNNGAYFKARGMDKDTMWNTYQGMVRNAEIKYGAEFPEVVALMDELILESRKATYGS